MKRAVWALMAVLVCGCGAQSAAQTPAEGEKVRDIKRLLELTGAGGLGVQLGEQQMEQLRPLFSTLPPEVRDKVLRAFEEEMRKELTAEKLIELVIPIYDKHLTAEDVRGLIAFYETPLGRKVVEVLPQISREAFERGAARGGEIGEGVLAKLLADGTLTPPPPARKTPRRPAAKRRRT